MLHKNVIYSFIRFKNHFFFIQFHFFFYSIFLFLKKIPKKSLTILFWWLKFCNHCFELFDWTHCFVVTLNDWQFFFVVHYSNRIVFQKLESQRSTETRPRFIQMTKGKQNWKNWKIYLIVISFFLKIIKNVKWNYHVQKSMTMYYYYCYRCRFYCCHCLKNQTNHHAYLSKEFHMFFLLFQKDLDKLVWNNFEKNVQQQYHLINRMAKDFLHFH